MSACLRTCIPNCAGDCPRTRRASRGTHAVAEFATAQGAADGNLWAIKLAVSEAVTNAVVHASRGV